MISGAVTGIEFGLGLSTCLRFGVWDDIQAIRRSCRGAAGLRDCSAKVSLFAPRKVSRSRVQLRSLQTNCSRGHLNPISASNSHLTAFAIQARGGNSRGFATRLTCRGATGLLGLLGNSSPVAPRQVSRSQVELRSLQIDRSRSHFDPKTASDWRLAAFAIHARGGNARDLATRLSSRGAAGLL